MSTAPTATRPTGAAKKTAAAKTDNTPTKEAQGKKLAEARTAAIGQLLENHRAEFNTLMEAEAKERGVTWKRRPTEAEKRRAKLEALLAEDPSLAEVAQDIIAGQQPIDGHPEVITEVPA